MHLVAQSASSTFTSKRRSSRSRWDGRADLDGELLQVSDPDDIGAWPSAAGFRVVAQWIDREDGFALTLLEAV